jgi:thiol-disulfide isomerase/thioredoxin
MNMTRSTKFLLFFSMYFWVLRADAKNITVSGKIDRMQYLDPSVFMDKSISVEYYNGIGKRDRTTSQIQADGQFSLTFSVTFPQIILIQSGSGYYTEALVYPGQALKMSVRYERCEVRTEGYPAIHYKPEFSTAFVGPDAKIQNTFINLRIKLQPAIDSILSKATFQNNGSLNNDLSKVPGITEAFFRRHAQYDRSLIPFVKHELSFALIGKRMNAMPDSSSASDFRDINFPKIQYFSNEVMNVINRINTVSAAKNVEFRMLSIFNNPRLHFGPQEQLLIRKSFNATLTRTDSANLNVLSERIKKNPTAMASVDSILAISECSYFFEALPSDVAELLTARKVMELKSDLNNNFSYVNFLNKITNPELLSYIRYELKAKKTYQYVDYTKSTETDIITAIAKAFPNQNLYIDVWATWCAPCRAEFPFYPNLINRYKDDVVFVLLCASSEEHLYEELIAKLPFKAHHYFLNDLQYAKLKNDFKIVGIPHYIFINRRGKITNNFTRPSNINGLQKEIDGELKSR